MRESASASAWTSSRSEEPARAPQPGRLEFNRGFEAPDRGRSCSNGTGRWSAGANRATPSSDAEQDIADNLRLPQGAVSSAMHFAVLRGWIEETEGRYRLSWTWFRSITRVLTRQNLLAR